MIVTGVDISLGLTYLPWPDQVLIVVALILTGVDIFLGLTDLLWPERVLIVVVLIVTEVDNFPWPDLLAVA